MTGKSKRPRDKAGWEGRYTEGDVPWDSGEPDLHLRRVLDAYDIIDCKALEIGCGTGTNSIWMAEQGLAVTGLDLAANAVDKAREKIAAAGVSCHALAADFLVDDVPGAPFGFVYDRGCFHVFDEANDRSRFASRVADLLMPRGLWHSLIGSTDGPPRDTGPPRVSGSDILTAVEPYFEVLELRSTDFDSEHLSQAKAWVMVARRREFYS